MAENRFNARLFHFEKRTPKIVADLIVFSASLVRLNDLRGISIPSRQLLNFLLNLKLFGSFPLIVIKRNDVVLMWGLYKHVS